MSKFKVGDSIIANELSNTMYYTASLEHKCVGVVTEINLGHVLADITIKITQNINDDVIGRKLSVSSKYFDLFRKPDL